jgi:hypothetical protein
VVFFIFLAGIAVWIWWVNKELAKERAKEAGEEKKDEENKNIPS